MYVSELVMFILLYCIYYKFYIILQLLHKNHQIIELIKNPANVKERAENLLGQWKNGAPLAFSLAPIPFLPVCAHERYWHQRVGTNERS